jgi:hypothetical protein
VSYPFSIKVNAPRQLSSEEITLISEATVRAVENQKAERRLKREDHEDWIGRLWNAIGWLPSMVDVYPIFFLLYFINPFFSFNMILLCFCQYS